MRFSTVRSVIARLSIIAAFGLAFLSLACQTGSPPAPAPDDGGMQSEMNEMKETTETVPAIPAFLPAPGATVPAPVFERGDQLAEPLPEGSPKAKAFTDFYNATYLQGAPQIDLLTSQDVVWFPPQMFGDTSLEAVYRRTPGQAPNCDDPNGYPLYCDDSFSTGQFCQACHDSALFVTGGGLPEMSYYSEQHEWLANWTQYGDWSASIMALASRDPVWQAQIETETNLHQGADSTIIQDICFRCHGAMGERQLQMQHGAQNGTQAGEYTTAENPGEFCTDVFYAEVPGIVPANNRGKPFPFDPECQPIPGKPVGTNQDAYAKFGSLARNGVSCEVCHRLGPPGESGQWDGTHFEPFYGPVDKSLAPKQTDNPLPLIHDFTATFEYDLDSVMTPDPLKSLDPEPMKTDDNLDIAQAVNQKDDVSYLRQSVLCGSCHVLIVPKIPTVFAPGAKVPPNGSGKLGMGAFPFYQRPKVGCEGDRTFDAAGNPVADPCVAVSYEQATYLEWINSDFASEKDNVDTCQGCHMPFVTDPKDPLNHGAIMAQATEGLSAKQYRRHRMMGINLFVFEMFAQFPDVLGVELYDQRIPQSYANPDGQGSTPFIQHNLLNGEMSIVEQATSQANGNGLDPLTARPTPQAAAEIDIVSVTATDDTLQADLLVTNHTGHKFPSGAGFRRAFLKFEVLDADRQTLWVSGDTNEFGAICEGTCQMTGPGQYNLLPSETSASPLDHQPHWQVIESQNQVQIYEVSTVDDTGRITSSTLALFHDAKDNRILPRGFTLPKDLGCDDNPKAGQEIFGIPQCSAAFATEPQLDPLNPKSQIKDDPYYRDPKLTGADRISYRIPLADIPGQPAGVRVTMQYQTIPPAFLAGRFLDGYDQDSQQFLPATERAIYLTSHLDTELGLTSTHPDNRDLPMTEGWTMNIHQVTVAVDSGEAGSGAAPAGSASAGSAE